MKKINFKNGTTIDISLEVASIIRDRILEGCKKFQTFSDENNEVLLIVNLDEVVYIN